MFNFKTSWKYRGRPDVIGTMDGNKRVFFIGCFANKNFEYNMFQCVTEDSAVPKLRKKSDWYLKDLNEINDFVRGH